uniref:Ovule protein n=1 Tax=Meloidogyne incognita TaxID=6306 RepID=A0A914LAI4_MELIC
MSTNWNSLLVNQKFSEVPFNCVNQKTMLLMLQKLPKWMSIFPIHINLCIQIRKEIELLINKFFYFLISSWLLAIKLKI